MRSEQHTACSARNPAYRPSRLALARPPSRDLTRHGCRVRAYKDVLAACPAMVGGQGPCSKVADHPLCDLYICTTQVHRNKATKKEAWNRANRPFPLVLARPPSRDLTRHGCRVRAYTDVLAACHAMVGGQGPCSQAAGPRALHLIHVHYPATGNTTPKATKASCNSFCQPLLKISLCRRHAAIV